MEREHSQFSPELLQMMRDEEREKFLTALKNGASWAQLYQIRNTIRKLNSMIENAERDNGSDRNRSGKNTGNERSSEEKGPR